MNWFKKKQPDTRPASASAMAVAESLRKEPQRWKCHQDDFLLHDSGILIAVCGYTRIPDLDDEPDANGELIAQAVDDWVAEMMKLPPRQPMTPSHPTGA